MSDTPRVVNIADKTTLDQVNAAVSSAKTTVEATQNTVGTINTTTAETKNLASTINTNAADIKTNVFTVGVPTQDGTLVYSGSTQSPSWNGFDPKAMTISGTTTGVNVGNYTATFALKTGYKWADGTTSNKNVTWFIRKTAGRVELSQYVVAFHAYEMEQMVVVNRAGSGAVTVTSNNEKAATARVSNTNIVNVFAQGNGSAIITVNVAADTNHEACSVSLVVSVGMFHKIYGFKLNKADSNPATCMEYIDDAKDFTPAKMNFETNTFDYGSWKDVFFVKNNYPCMLKSDGTEAYKLNPNDYTKKADGTDSDVANTAFDGNAMSAIPLTYVYAYEEGGYEYIRLSNAKVDENYHAIAHTREDGSVRDYIYLSIYKGSLVGEKLRSLSGQALIQSKTAAQELAYARANGAYWCTRTWGQRTLINYMLMLLARNLNSQAVYGAGVSGKEAVAESMVNPGTAMNTYGQFWGTDDNTLQVKVFHMEDWWGNQWERIAGLVSDNGVYKVSLTGPYNTTGEGYATVDGGIVPATGFIKNNRVTPFGRLPIETGGSSTTYDCDYYWGNLLGFRYALYGGSCAGGMVHGWLCSDMNNASVPEHSPWTIGACLSYV